MACRFALAARHAEAWRDANAKNLFQNLVG
jgi:hypothetical protein